MKLNSIKDKIRYSIRDSIYSKCIDKTYDSTSPNMWWKISNEIRIPNIESISRMKNRTLDNLRNEIN